MGRDQKKSPEQMAAIMAQLKRDKEKQKRKDALKNVKNGQYIIFGISFVVGGLSWLLWTQTEDVKVTGIVGGLAGVYLILGILYYKDPHTVSVLGLVLYAFIALASLGVIFLAIHAMVIGGLIRAIQYGQNYKTAINYKESDPLDQGLFDEK